MIEKTIYTRVQNKHATESEWLTSTLVPLVGELIVYEPDDTYNYSRYKIGDGVTAVNDLPFSNVQPDWNQIDPNAADYVKGRTHGEFETVLDKVSYQVLQEGLADLPMSSGCMNKSICNSSNIVMPDNVFIRVRTGNTVYIIQSIPLRENGRQDRVTVTLDNGLTLRHGAQLYQAGATKPDRKNLYYQVLAFTTDTNLIGQEYTIEMVNEIPTVVQLDEKYIPNTIARTTDLLQSDWEQTDDTKLDFIKNKPDVITPDMILQMFSETGAAQPIADADNSVITTDDNKILIL